MIVPDANLLLYAYCAPSPWHPASRAWWESALSGHEPVGLPWAVIQAFLRIGTNPRAFQPAFDAATGVEIVSGWLQRRRVLPLHPGERHWQVLSDLIVTCQIRGPLLADAHLAALAIENGALLCSADRGFSRFPGLRWHNPLAA
ncbi:MAG TPA: TA system VapC family ribonuclease toxin [Terriglobales bacterium]|nr:TA system VapC family ribonuclease toxin [Terriglobales bacterium]